MACCALAAFLISQIIFALDWMRERLGLGGSARSVDNSVVAWRLSDGAAIDRRATPARRPVMSGRLALAAAGGAVAFIVLAAMTLRVEAGPHPWNTMTLICTGHGLARLARPAAG